MNERAEALLDAQVDYWLEQLQSEALQNLIATEIEAFSHWLKKIKLEDITTPDIINQLIVTGLLDRELPESSYQAIVDVITQLFYDEQWAQWNLEETIDRETFDQIVHKLVELEDVRNQVIHQVLHSPIYTEMLSDVLYYAIKQYALEENLLTKKIPGLSQMMKMGKWGINKTVPNLEQIVEQTVKSYIQSNIKGTVDLSERLVTKSLNKDSIGHLANNVWENSYNKPYSLAQTYVRESDLDDFNGIGQQVWKGLKDKPLLRETVEHFTHKLFEHINQQPLGDWFDTLGGDWEILIDQLYRAAEAAFQPALESGFLEERLRAQLRPFYSSAVVTDILEG